MNGLTLHVRNFRAIKSADIELAGLTVLAGVNSSGKSTLVRLFHRLICIEANFNGYAAKDTYRYFVKSVLTPLRRVLASGFRDHELIRLSMTRRPLPQNGERLFLGIAESLKRILTNKAVSGMIRDPRFIDSMYAYVPDNCSDVPKLADSQNVVQWANKLEQFFVKRYKALVERKEGSSSLFFTSEINDETLVDVGDTAIQEDMDTNALTGEQSLELKISDGDVAIVDLADRTLPLGTVFAPRQSFYIAHPSVDFPSIRMNGLKLNDIMYPIPEDRLGGITSSLTSIGIESLMGGRVSVPREKEFVIPSEWLFNDGSHLYNLSKCAEGIKSLATISILDKYQLLGPGALLIIDEPEVHLHPQWVVGMAHVLVKLAKDRNVKVLITTHSPDLVHALRDFSENENFAANTSFYLSHKAEQDDFAYTFQPLGMEIGPIFSVFNRAKEQIAEIAQAIREG